VIATVMGSLGNLVIECGDVSAPSKALNCLACCWLGQLVSTWQVAMGWPDIHWLARDQGGLVAASLSLS
jgi:hypothetical protein